ncbi:glycosyl hydrolase [Reichenbachiella sp. 5M10]|uniref:glycoside hydrolase family 3 N-terminal domain-containing protein n=1 Tax=Reichenbachiella sp. 5M10 TaxID=1889772 RepID=UPI000C161FBD|nr:glycoside hydrolase family 3 N-terminal domain-containing protein [Reichenbachiella sp. 5M10]PIB34320.1 glycosyl hydrolase [Reichenbachiella sp. 5M10]
MKRKMMNILLPLMVVGGLVVLGWKSPTSESSEVEQRIEALIATMSIDEKIGQLNQRGTSSRENGISDELKEMVRRGQVGSFLNVQSQESIVELQRIAVEESPHGIPLIFARDVIHGFKTIFPIPLGQAASWNPELVERGARVAAIEASSMGIRWTFAPMIDIARDPRWGRIAESSGEDPYLSGVMGAAAVRGFQGDLSQPNTLAACAKHFIGYGAAEGGRDYNTAVISDPLLHNVYLKPFRAAADAGVASFMSSFNEVNGVPASGNEYVLREILRDDWGFDGIVVSDWNSVTEMITHGYSENEKEAAYSAAQAGVDMEMTSQAYAHHMKGLIAEGRLSMEQLDEKVKNILRVKSRLGLFEEPYFDVEQDVLYAEEHLASAKKMAQQSMVLLKNNGVLPLSPTKVAVLGPLAHAPREQLGTWIFDGDESHSVTPWSSIQEEFGDQASFVSGLSYSRDQSTEGFKAAIKAAKGSDVVLFFAGEEAILSGEAHSRADINLPGAQEQLIREIAKTGKPIVLVVLAGRPITLSHIIDEVDAVLVAWHPGTMAGPAVVDILTGKVSPSGRLPVSWPKSVGQIPIYYNHKKTGRPASEESFVHIDDIPLHAWQSSLGNTSHYLDEGFRPMYPFGYGLTYSQFEYSKLRISNDLSKERDSLIVSARIQNIGKVQATEVVQFYVQDSFGSLTRPVRELKGFQRLELLPNEVTEVRFILTKNDLAFYTADQEWVAEPGGFRIWVGQNAEEGLEGSFELRDE